MVLAVGVCGMGLAMHVDVCTHAHIHLHNLYTHVVLHLKSGVHVWLKYWLMGGKEAEGLNYFGHLPVNLC